jgi:hypothetical protein
MKRDLHDLLNEARGRGWVTELTHGGHWKLLGPDRQMLFTSSTPSDWRGLRNIRQDIRRAERRRQGGTP